MTVLASFCGLYIDTERLIKTALIIVYKVEILNQSLFRV